MIGPQDSGSPPPLRRTLARLARHSPIADLHRAALARTLPYGIASGPESDTPVEVVSTYGELELEYAALRKHAALLDLSHRGVITVTGADRLDFLNRMVTQELKGMQPGEVRRSFWLNRKGRIDADLRVIALADRVLMEMDVHAIDRTMEGLGAFIITEDVTLHDATASTHRLAVHGPTAAPLLEALTTPEASPPQLPPPGHAAQVFLAGTQCTLFRDDAAGVPGYELICPTNAALTVYQSLIEHGHDNQHGAAALREADATLGVRTRLRPIGWHAFNIARIEAGTPLYNIDFGPQNLPAESGVLHDRVSFKKGCYLGQEVVARMHARNQFKQVLVAVKFESPAATTTPEDFLFQPAEGAPLFPFIDNTPAPDAVGGITSSTISPLLGSVAIAFAQVRSGHHTPCTGLATTVDGRKLRGIVQPILRFLPTP